MREQPWWDDDNHPLYGPFHHALARPWSHLDGAWPQTACTVWFGRGLAREIGTRAFAALMSERPGWWPRVLDEFEWMLEDKGLL